MVVGDAKPFIGALITIDPEAIEGWKQRNGKPAGTSAKLANLAVSHRESIRGFRIPPVDFTEDTGESTPTTKVKLKVVAEKFVGEIDAIYHQG